MVVLLCVVVSIVVIDVVNGPWLTLELIRIFMLEFQLGSVICECVCLFACLCVVCFYEFLDGILMFPT